MPSREIRQEVTQTGTSRDLDGGFNKKAGTRETDFKKAPSAESAWQGISKAPKISED